MRRFVAVFVATVAGLVVLLSFKTAVAKAPRPIALSGVTPGSSSAPPDSAAPVSSAAGSSAPASSAPLSSAAASSAASSAVASNSAAATATSAAKASPTPTKSAAKPTPKPTAKPTPKPTPKPTNTTKTVTGSAITVGEGRRVFGVVQVQLTLTNGKITSITPLQVPQNDRHSADLSSFSIPSTGPGGSVSAECVDRCSLGRDLHQRGLRPIGASGSRCGEGLTCRNALTPAAVMARPLVHVEHVMGTVVSFDVRFADESQRAPMRAAVDGSRHLAAPGRRGLQHVSTRKPGISARQGRVAPRRLRRRRRRGPRVMRASWPRERRLLQLDLRRPA